MRLGFLARSFLLIVAFITSAIGSVQEPGTFDPLRGSLPRDEAQPIYSSDTTDGWNRVFHLLFTRALDVRLLIDGPPDVAAGSPSLQLSEHTTQRIENGDRAIDPLYPSWLWMGSRAFDMSTTGSWHSLREPQYSRLVGALGDVRRTARSKAPVARAVMQADLWSAHDMLHALLAGFDPPSAEGAEQRRRAVALTALLAEAMRALALTPDEIRDLPDTYQDMVRAERLPDIFAPAGDWFEVRWWPDRMHDRAAGHRRASRVFVKPATRPPDPQAFIDSLRDERGAEQHGVAATALVTQLLLISRDGRPVPSPITYDVQMLTHIERDGSYAEIEVRQYELSRRRLVMSPEDDALVLSTGDDPAYLPIAGNDLSFATRPQPEEEPILVPLRRRCTACHDSDLRKLVTFSPTTPAVVGRRRPVEILASTDLAHARSVADYKLTLDNFKSLRRHWSP